MLKARIATIGLSLALGLSMVAPASAVTVAELQAQINALMAQLSALQGGTTSVGTTFTADLTVGSTGAQVSALQQVLVSNGYLVMPSGVAMGYFGSLTKSAVMKWQAAVGLPSTGFFGPMSRAKLNGSTGATGTVPGTTIGGVTSGTISTPGVEGTVTVTKNPSPASGTKVYEGDVKKAVLGIKLEAKSSDIKIERIKLDLDETGNTATVDSQFYTKFAQKVYIMDGSTVLASADLNSSTVVEESNEISITLSGMSFIVPKDTTKVLTVALDARASWDSTYDTDSWTVNVPAEGVRGVDGAGVNQYGPAAALTAQSITSEGELAESATLTVSTDSNTPKDMEKVCTLSSTEDECDGLELLRFNVRAEKDNVLLTDLDVSVQKTGTGGATTTNGYLYDGSTLVGSATLYNQSGASSARFSDIDFSIPKDTTKTLTFKIDVQDTTVAASTYSASTTASLFTSENSAGTTATVSGNGVGESIVVRKIGPEFTLVSAGTPAYTAAQGFAGATSSAKVDFVIRMKAVGGDIVFGDSASTTYPLIVLGTSNGATASSSVLYRGGAAVSGGTHANTAEFVASSTSITVPSGVTSTTTNSWTLSEGNSVDIPVSMVFNGRYTDSLGNTGAITTGAWAVQINQLQWATAADVGERHVSDFMSGNSAWRSGTVTMP